MEGRSTRCWGQEGGTESTRCWMQVLETGAATGGREGGGGVGAGAEAEVVLELGVGERGSTAVSAVVVVIDCVGALALGEGDG